MRYCHFIVIIVRKSQNYDINFDFLCVNYDYQSMIFFFVLCSRNGLPYIFIWNHIPSLKVKINLTVLTQQLIWHAYELLQCVQRVKWSLWLKCRRSAQQKRQIAFISIGVRSIFRLNRAWKNTELPNMF